MDPSNDLDIKYRPQTLDEVVGQPEAVSVLRGFGNDFPRCMCFFGASGTGKSTMALVVANMMGIDRADLRVKNCGSAEPMEMVRDMERKKSASAIGGGKRLWILNEIQTFSRAKGAQEALLDVLEFSPPHVHYFMTTTDPKRILRPLRARAVMVELKEIRHADLTKLVKKVAKAEGISLDDELVQRIVEASSGSARDALKNLQKVAGITDPQERLSVIGTITDDKDQYGLIRALLPWGNASTSWASVSKILATPEVYEQEPEGLRIQILAAARAQLLKGNNPRWALKVATCLEKPFFDKASGHALLVAYIYEMFNAK